MKKIAVTKSILPALVSALCLTVSCAHSHRFSEPIEALTPEPHTPEAIEARTWTQKRALPDDEALVTLARFMSGHFSSTEQAAADSSYFDIRLVMEPIWTDRTDGIWLYVEQAVAGYEGRPLAPLRAGQATAIAPAT